MKYRIDVEKEMKYLGTLATPATECELLLWQRIVQLEKLLRDIDSGPVGEGVHQMIRTALAERDSTPPQSACSHSETFACGTYCTSYKPDCTPPQPDVYCHTLPNGECDSIDPRCMHNTPPQEPAAKMHAIPVRVDTWQDKETGMYIAKFHEVLESAETGELAIERLRSVLSAIGDSVRGSLAAPPDGDVVIENLSSPGATDKSVGYPASVASTTELGASQNNAPTQADRIQKAAEELHRRAELGRGDRREQFSVDWYKEVLIRCIVEGK